MQLAVRLALGMMLALVSPALADDISNWSSTDSSNNRTPPLGWPSGTMLPSQVEPTARAMMGAVRRFYDVVTGDAQDIHLLGCVGDGVTDDTACVQAAINASANKVLLVGPRLYKINAVTDNGHTVTIIGQQTVSAGVVTPATCVSGFVAGSVNLNLITLSNNGSSIKNTCIQMAASSGTNTSGAAITTSGGAAQQVISNQINNACIGINLVGSNAPIARHNYIFGITNSGCEGIVVGLGGLGEATTDAHLDVNSIDCGGTAAVPSTGDGIVLLASGGSWISEGEVHGCNRGLVINPGASQTVSWLYCNHTAFDSNADTNILISSSNATGVARGLYFDQCWSGSSGFTTVRGTQAGVTVQAGSGTVDGVSFLHQRVYAAGGHGFDLQGGNHISIRHSTVCGVGNGSATVFALVNVASNLNNVLINDNRLLGACDNVLAGQSAPNGIVLNGSNASTTITGNDLSSGLALGVAAIVGNPTNASVVANNTGVDTATNSVASASSIALTSPIPFWAITGTTGVSTITGNWFGRSVTLVTTSGAVVFSTGGNICLAYTSVQNAAFTAFYDSANSCWRLH